MKLYGFIVANSSSELMSDEKMCKVKAFTSPTHRNNAAYEAYTEIYDDLKNEGEIDKDYTHRKISKAGFLKLFSYDEPVIIQSYDYHINVEPFETDVDLYGGEEEPTGFRKIKHSEFLALVPGNEVYVRVGAEYYRSSVLEATRYNNDASSPDYEVATTNGACDEDSIYLKV